MAEPLAPPPAWLPDWRDASQYPKEMSRSEWRWQFLRRHPEYQAWWARLVDSPNRRYLVVNEILGANYAKTQAAANEMASMTGGGRVFVAAELEGLTSRFGVKVLLDPALDRIEPRIESMFWRKFEPYSWVSVPTHEQWEGEYAAGKRALVFDLRQPLGAQLDHAKNRLTREQMKIGHAQPDERTHAHLFPTYLRLLDAHAAVPRPTWEEIGTHPGLLEESEDVPAKAAHQTHSRAVVHLNKHFRY